jgi:hypothetical protein
MKYRAITANCGNDVIGKKASEQIAQKIHEDNADFYVLNCQEVSVEATKRQLQEAVGEGYTVVCLKKMTTHTKLSTQFHSGTGIATFVIHKNNVAIDLRLSQEARRSSSRSSGYNKGGVVTDFTVTKNHGDGTQEKIQVQAVSGHLDSSDTQKRTKDWHNINQAIAREITDWNSLVSACADLRLSGYDANTRNKLTDEGTVVNLWCVPGGTSTPEIQALHQAALGGQHFSARSTYKTHLQNITRVEDQKRPGYARGGTLDFVSIADGGEPSTEISSNGVIKIQSNAKDSGRDHDVIISPLKQYTPVNDFAKVRGQIAMHLDRVAPDLAGEIRALTENNETNRNKLIQVYQLFLSPKGLLHKAIALQTEKLACFERLTDSSLLQDDEIRNRIIETLFPSPWFENSHLSNVAKSAEQYKQKMDLMHLLLTSLNQCPSQSEVEGRIALYTAQVQKIESRTYNAEEANKQFKELQVREYLTLYAELRAKVAEYQVGIPHQRVLHHQGVEVLMEMKKIAPDLATIRELDPLSLSQLSRIAKHCSNAIDVLEKGGDVTPITTKLASLAQDVSGKPSPAWKALGMGLLVFACVALVVASVLAAIPTGGASFIIAAMGLAGSGVVADAIGMKAYEHGEEKELAKSVLDYKAVLEHITQDERLIAEDSEDSTYGDSLSSF